jgi:Asp-tRNA(Asn)/Glu-tRNA(Gln) amidotransferase A subunit family amidase
MLKKYITVLVVVGLSILFLSLMSEPTFKEKIKWASHLVGLDFTEDEIELMEEGVKENLDDYIKNRSYHIDNGTAPVLEFDPFPEGHLFSKGNNELNINIDLSTPFPSDSSLLAYYNIRQLASLIQSRKITSESLTQFFLRRLKKFDPGLHCVIFYMEERAMKQAQLMDQELAQGKYRGLLHGIPCGIKDLLSTVDYKTTWGATPYKDQNIDYDAGVVTMLENAGAVIIAKLTLGALAWGDVWYGEKTRNPWDTTSGSSGSSAGSASAVSAGLVPFAIGTETLGSIVSPSTVCGTTGLRPTYGRVSRYGAMALCWSMDKIGPITRDAIDAAIVLDAINQPDLKDPHQMYSAFSFDENRDRKSLRVGYIPAMESGDYAFKANDSLTIQTFRDLGYELEVIDFPEFPDIGIILTVEAATAFDTLTTSGLDDSLKRQIANAWPNVFRQGRLVPAVEYLKANRIRRQLIENMNDLMSEYDAIIHPSWNSSGLAITNYTGHPTIVMPNGFREERPTSFSITGKLHGEEAIISLADEFQKATNHHKQHPEWTTIN